MKIIFFGSSKFVIPIIKILNQSFDLVLVVTTDQLDGAVPTYCQQNKIEFISIKKFNEVIIQKLKSSKYPIAILADFGLIIPEKILNLFPKGIINIHPSLLPKYRGPTPVQTAILEGEKITGVSIIRLDKQVDHGPILNQVKEPILPNDTSESLYQRLFDMGANLLPKTITRYLKGDLKLSAQNHKEATFTNPLTRQNGFIDLTKIKPQKLKQMIKAYFPWPGVWSEIRTKDKVLRIKFLPENKIQIEGKRPISYKDFINGYPEVKNLLEKIH